MDDGATKLTPAQDARRQAILDVAREAFITEGFAAASMSAIAARLGGSKGTLYNYFASKEALFSAVIQDECDRKQAALFDSLQSEGDDVQVVLRNFGRRYAELVLDERTVVFSRVVIAESTRFPELGRALYEAGPMRGRERLAIFVRSAIEAGRLGPGDPGRIVDQFCDMCLTTLYRRRLMNVAPPPPPEIIEENVEAALGVILRAYPPPGA